MGTLLWAHAGQMAEQSSAWERGQASQNLRRLQLCRVQETELKGGGGLHEVFNCLKISV